MLHDETESIAIFRLKMNMKEMKEASRQMKAIHPLSYSNLFKQEIMLLLEVFRKLQGIYFLVVVISGQVSNFKWLTVFLILKF